MLKELEEKLTEHDERLNSIDKMLNEFMKNHVSSKLAYTPKEAGEALGVKATTILNWIHSEKLHATNTGKNFLIPVESIKHLLTLKTI